MHLQQVCRWHNWEEQLIMPMFHAAMQRDLNMLEKWADKYNEVQQGATRNWTVLEAGTCTGWGPPSWTWVSMLLLRRLTVTKVILSSQHWWGHTWSSVLLSTEERWSFWRKSTEEPQRWWKDWSFSLMRKGRAILDSSASSTIKRQE